MARARRIAGLATAVALALVACAPAPVRVLSEYAVTPDYSRALVERDLAGRAIAVELHGDPFGLPPEALAGQLAAQMTDAHAPDLEPAARFVSHPAAADADGYRVVWWFDPPRELAPDEICAARPDRARKAARPIDAYVALCRDGRALTAVRAKLYYADTPNSLEFIGLVDDITRALFPTQLPAVRRPGDARLAPQVPHVAR